MCCLSKTYYKVFGNGNINLITLGKGHFTFEYNVGIEVNGSALNSETNDITVRNVAGNGSLEDEVVLSADGLVAHSYDFGTNCNILVAEILADGGIEALAGDDVVVADELRGEF